MLVGVLYALCVVMPSAAVAFGAGEHPVHCLTDQQLGLHVHQYAAGHGQGHAHPHPQAHEHAQAHLHAAGAMHRHGESRHPGPSDRDNDPAACCGLFGLTAMAVDPQLDLGMGWRKSSIVPLSFAELTGRGPDRINRPPIAPLSL